MSASNIVLADAQGTPVNHTFVPVGLQGDTFWWEDQSAASSIGNWKASLKLQRPSNATAGQNSSQRMYRVTAALHEPVLETLGTSTISGIPAAPTVSYISRATGEFALPERSTLQNRKDIRKMFALILADAQFVAAIEQLLDVTR